MSDLLDSVGKPDETKPDKPAEGSEKKTREVKAWEAQLKAELRGHPDLDFPGGISELAEKYLSEKSKPAKAKMLKEMNDEERSSVLKELGVPEKPEEYSKDLPEETRQLFHKLKITKDQEKELITALKQNVQQTEAQQQEVKKKQIIEQKMKLEDMWKENVDEYAKTVKLVNQKFITSDLRSELDKSGLSNNALFLDFLRVIGDKLVYEDRVLGDRRELTKEITGFDYDSMESVS